jgi:hypothetical protein
MVTPPEELDGLYKRLEEEFDTDELTEENVKGFMGKGKGRTELAKEIAKASKISKKIKEAPSREELKDINKEIKKLPIKEQEMKEKVKARRKELTSVEKFAKEKKINLSKYKIGRLENRKDGSQWITIRDNRKGRKGRIITGKKIK